jgi:Tat protein secretion system quality control protein TatD with DNase activity
VNPLHGGDGSMFVLFSGGCTRAEVSEVQALAKEVSREMIVVTTDTISGDDFVYGFMG